MRMNNDQKLMNDLIWALVHIMDSCPDHDIQGETGLSDADCQRIADIRRQAEQLFKERGL